MVSRILNICEWYFYLKQNNVEAGQGHDYAIPSCGISIQQICEEMESEMAKFSGSGHHGSAFGFFSLQLYFVIY